MLPKRNAKNAQELCNRRKQHEHKHLDTWHESHAKTAMRHLCHEACTTSVQTQHKNKATTPTQTKDLETRAPARTRYAPAYKQQTGPLPE